MQKPLIVCFQRPHEETTTVKGFDAEQTGGETSVPKKKGKSSNHILSHEALWHLRYFPDSSFPLQPRQPRKKMLPPAKVGALFCFCIWCGRSVITDHIIWSSKIKPSLNGYWFHVFTYRQSCLNRWSGLCGSNGRLHLGRHLQEEKSKEEELR